MKIYLDDERKTPEGAWVRCWTVPQTIKLLERTPVVDMISLDHDLGTDPETGYDVLMWIENEIATNPEYEPPLSIHIHTANPPARRRMELAKINIYKMIQRRLVNEQN